MPVCAEEDEEGARGEELSAALVDMESPRREKERERGR